MATTRLSSYAFVADPGSLRQSTGRQLNWDKVASSYLDSATGKKVVPDGAVLALQSGGKVVPRASTVAISAAADDGSDVITVTSAAHGFSVGDTVVIAGANEARFNGTVTVATVADANTFTYVPTATSSSGSATGTLVASYQAWGILIGEAREDAPEHALSGYGVLIGAHLFENLLPDSTGTPKVLPTAYKTELGSLFTFEQYSDSRIV